MDQIVCVCICVHSNAIKILPIGLPKQLTNIIHNNNNFKIKSRWFNEKWWKNQGNGGMVKWV